MQPEQKSNFYIQVLGPRNEVEQISYKIAHSLEDEGCELEYKSQPSPTISTHGILSYVNMAFTTGELET